MKSLHKSLVILCAILMILGCTMPVFAADIPAGSGSIIVNKPSDPAATLTDRTLEAWQLFSAKYNTEGTSAVYNMSDDQWAVAKAITGVNGLDVAQDTKENTLKSITDWLTANKDNADNLQKFAVAVQTANSGEKLPKRTLDVAPDGSKATLENIELGYYMIVDKTASFDNDNLQSDTKALIALTNTSPKGTLDLKAETVTFDKKIDNKTVQNDKTNEAKMLKYDNHSIGELVNYDLTSKVPDMKGYSQYYFVFKDTLSKGLEYQENSLVVTIGKTPLTKGTNYEVVYTNGNGTADSTITVYFKDAYTLFKDKKGQDILLTYDAKVTKNAVIGVEGNPNKAQLFFKRDPNQDMTGITTPDNPPEDKVGGKTPEKHTKSFVTEIILNKTDDKGAALAGATFTLTGERVKTVLVTGQDYLVSTITEIPAGYTEVVGAGPFYKLKNGSYTTTPSNSDTADQYESTTVTYKLYNFSKVEKTPTSSGPLTLTTGPDGKLTFTGLGDGTYTLTETSAPAGYNKADPITITITCTEATDELGTTNCTWSHKIGDKEMDGTNKNEVTVKNTTNELLPKTGGIGTTIFYTVGGLLALVAVVVLVSRKRMLSNQR